MTRARAEELMAEEIKTLEQCLAIPSSGNREQDEAYIHEAAVSNAMVAANFCPNGCGEMFRNEALNTQTCLTCNFVQHNRHL